MDTNDLILWGIALIVSIIFAIAGIKAYRKYHRQDQKVGSGGIGIQSGRDTKINDR
ncbi:hypothetical protein [Chenggangzhangella methanolivorans]|uniref:Uncharacterized protein n=1 Tax=Chenggangzhangella methanolivorans TaxID=1437009 RepID=A0A9E6R8M5_9HYPH|nr:hypothetical protein [Chenggangzhangella methanolivorans]QZN98632.1 hypothetical protein K6K41_16590 [Chenggangzhangella methanolivorans]